MMTATMMARIGTHAGDTTTVMIVSGNRAIPMTTKSATAAGVTTATVAGTIESGTPTTVIMVNGGVGRIGILAHRLETTIAVVSPTLEMAKGRTLGRLGRPASINPGLALHLALDHSWQMRVANRLKLRGFTTMTLEG